jgi:serine/threonine protein kinase
MAPEVIKQSKYGRKADIWSFGCCLIEMKTGRNPWSEYNFDNAVEAILKIGVSNDLPQIP